MEKQTSNARAYWVNLLEGNNYYGRVPQQPHLPAEALPQLELSKPPTDPETYNCVWVNGEWVSLGC